MLAYHIPTIKYNSDHRCVFESIHTSMNVRINLGLRTSPQCCNAQNVLVLWRLVCQISFINHAERMMKATIATIQTMSSDHAMSLGSAARAVILNLLSRWAAMASHSDEVFRLGL